MQIGRYETENTIRDIQIVKYNLEATILKMQIGEIQLGKYISQNMNQKNPDKQALTSSRLASFMLSSYRPHCLPDRYTLLGGRSFTEIQNT